MLGIPFAAKAVLALVPAAALCLVPAPEAPGTATRPVLSFAEAAAYHPAAYLARSGPVSAPVDNPWTAPPPRPQRPAFVVGPEGARGVTHPSVQAAVNAAIALGGTARIRIEVRPGTYTGTVYVPAGSPPITVAGVGDREKVRLELTLDGAGSTAAYIAVAGPYAATDPGYAMYFSCANKLPEVVVGTGCSGVVWSQAADFTLENLTVANTVPDSVGTGTHQAVAVRTDGDRTTLQRVHLVSRQDTLYLNTLSAATIARARVLDSLIEGDTDFVFGRATVVFERSEFRLVSTRKANGVIFSPATAPSWPYGFLVIHSKLTTDGGSTTGHFARAWDSGAGTTGYLPGTSPNGQLLIRDSTIGLGFDLTTPYVPAATTSRPFTANLDPARDLNDPHFNRLYEFNTLSRTK